VLIGVLSFAGAILGTLGVLEALEVIDLIR
jgi:hypothetical protein